MDIYDDTHNISSSEEESEEDLITTAIRTNHVLKTQQKELQNNIKTNKTDVKSRYKRQKLTFRAIRRSVKWLNNKKKREKYKQLISKKSKELDIQGSSSMCKNNFPIEKKNIEEFDCKTKNSECSSHKKADIFEEKREKTLITNGSNCQSSSFKGKIKRSRSVSPTLLKQGVGLTCMDSNVENGTLLLKEVNKLFPKYNKVLEDFVRSSTCSIKSIEQKISNILSEIQTLSDIIETKEFEWNKLLHLRKVKEEVIMHLVRKKNILEIKQKKTNQIKMKPCKASDMNSTGESFDLYDPRNFVTSTAHSLIEQRANMKTEDLEKEKKNINRLHSILVSENILPKSGGTEKKMSNILMESSYHSTAFDSNKSSICGKNVIWQHNLFHDVKRLVSDFQQNPAGHERKRSFDNAQHHMLQYDTERVMKKSTRNLTDTKNDLNENGVPLCQECKSHQSRFVCAGCANQWYCSRRCQVSAWDKHSDICNE